jgi:uncharacterized protein (TIGR02145 family)
MGKEIKCFYAFIVIGLLINLTYSCKKDDATKKQSTQDGETIITTDPITDIDGNIYKTIQIGNQLWMASNLNVSHYKNGESLPNISDKTVWDTLSTGAYCYYSNQDSYSSIYGKLYNFYTVVDERNICPDGWHVPSDAEWTTLIDFLGDSIAGPKLMDTNSNLWVATIITTKQNTGFNALPAGFRFFNNQFSGMGYSAFFWSSTDRSYNTAWFRLVKSDAENVVRDFAHHNLGYSVRCLKD